MLDAIREMVRKVGLARPDHHFDDDDARLAVAALLLHAADVDGGMSPAERAKVRDLLRRQYHLSAEDLDRLIADATRAEEEAVDLYSFTSVLKRQLGDADRVAVVRLLWEIVYADGEAQEFEENLVWRVAELLAVPREQRLSAKAAVADSITPPNDAEA